MNIEQYVLHQQQMIIQQQQMIQQQQEMIRNNSLQHSLFSLGNSFYNRSMSGDSNTSNSMTSDNGFVFPDLSSMMSLNNSLFKMSNDTEEKKGDTNEVDADEIVGSGATEGTTGSVSNYASNLPRRRSSYQQTSPVETSRVVIPSSSIASRSRSSSSSTTNSMNHHRTHLGINSNSSLESKKNEKRNLNEFIRENVVKANPKYESKNKKLNTKDNSEEKSQNRKIIVKKEVACRIIREYGTDPVTEEEKDVTKNNGLFDVNTNRFLRALFVMNLSKKDNEIVQLDSEKYPYLYIGSVAGAYNLDTLKKNGITHILTCGQNMRAKFPEIFKYKFVECVDLPDQDMMTFFEDCFDFIDNVKAQGGKILVHCFAGRSRSATILTAYLMAREKMQLQDAIALVKENRPIVNPNSGFRLQLKQFQNELFGNSTDGTAKVSGMEV